MPGNALIARRKAQRGRRQRVSASIRTGSRSRAGMPALPVAICRALLKASLQDGKKLDNKDVLKSIWAPHIGGASSSVKMRLPFSLLTVTSNVGAVVALSYGASLSQLSDYVSIQAMFSGWRPIRGEFHYAPFFLGTSTNTGAVAAGLEFNTGTSAPGSIAEALETENSQVFPLFKSRSWKFDFSQLRGDLDFLDTAGSNTPLASLKMYSYSGSGVAISATYGALWGWMDCEFRGIE